MFTATAEADPDLLDCLIEEHEARWRASGFSGVIAENHATAFLKDAAAALAKRDFLRLFSLQLDGKVVAIIFATNCASTISSYITAFHPEYRKHGFGHELLLRSLEYAHQHGCRWDFLRGTEPYKFEWGARIIPKIRVVIER